MDKINLQILRPNAKTESLLVDSISSTNEKGKFDILPSHANFITLIKDYAELRIGENNKRIKFKNGVLYCESNQVKIFVGI